MDGRRANSFSDACFAIASGEKKWPGRTESRIRVHAVGVRQQSDFERDVVCHAVESD